MRSAIRELPERLLHPDVLVVGAGPAGRAAAAAAMSAGAGTILLDEHAETGAVPMIQASAWGAFPPNEIAATDGETRFIVRPSRLVLAAGAFEAALPLPGWTLPGCTTTGALRADFVSPGRIVIAGSGLFNIEVAAELVRAGRHVAAVFEAAPRPALSDLAAISPARAWRLRRTLGTLRRARVPILWSTRATAIAGAGRVEGLVVDGATVAADIVALHWGVQAETGLARALGAAHHVVRGHLETITDADGRTSLPTVFVVGEGGRAALLRGRAAGLAAARDLGRAARRGPRAAHRRAERVERVLASAARPDPASLPNDTVLCRCEGVTAGAIRNAMNEGAISLATIKRATRAGMGHCGGRLCNATIAAIAGAVDETGWAAPRLPLRPVQAAAILADRPEPADTVVAAPTSLRWITAAPASTHPGHADTVVIGGGLIGLATALYLARDGADVLLLDRGEPAMGASTANAGSLHVQLVPYVYKPGGGPMADTIPLGPASIALWRALAADAGEDLGLRTEGGLVLAETETEMTVLREKAAFERTRGNDVEVVGPTDLHTIAPGLADSFAGASFCPGEGQGDPLRGASALRSLARRAGVRIAAGLPVQRLQADAHAWVLTTPAGPIRAGYVVNTAGVQAGRIAATAGVALPAYGLVQQVIATAPAPTMLRQLVAWTGRHLSLKQGNGGHLLLGGGWPGNQDPDGAARLVRHSIEGNVALACRALPQLRDVAIVRAWTALAPNQDRPPLIAATPGHPGLFHAVTGNGYTLAPVIGRMLADAIRTGAQLPAAFAL